MRGCAWIFLNVTPANDQNNPEWWALLLLGETEAQRGEVICLHHTWYWQSRLGAWGSETGLPSS